MCLNSSLKRNTPQQKYGNILLLGISYTCSPYSTQGVQRVQTWGSRASIFALNYTCLFNQAASGGTIRSHRVIMICSARRTCSNTAPSVTPRLPAGNTNGWKQRARSVTLLEPRAP